MKRLLVALGLVLLVAQPLFATFSIVAFDRETGELGIATASRYFAVGATVPWAEADIGAIATQAAVNAGYGRQGLQLLREGLTAQQALDRLLDQDEFPGKEGRQIAIIDAGGNIAVHTGIRALEWKGHRKAATYSVQGNILVGPEVLDAMVRAFEDTPGELAERLYAALKAGDDAGGDRRGRQSASMLVVRKLGGRTVNDDRYVFVNVDDHPQPMVELRRLLDMNLLQNSFTEFYTALEEQNTEALTPFAQKVVKYASENVDGQLMAGTAHYYLEEKDEAVLSLRRARELDPSYFELMWSFAVLVT